ncbi:MAG TPA: hypothetical protein VLA34_11035 [Candidatus Krumholzibacterium sp.]|nr:hypothetical protein [Candidatus Krumholzibacterium sp.]
MMDGDFIRESIEKEERFDLGTGAKSAFRSLYTSLTLVHRPTVILPTLIYFLFQLGLMYLYLGSHGRPWTSFWALFNSSIDADQLGHFPQHLFFMQLLLGRVTIILDVFVSIAFQASTAMLVSMAYRSRKVSIAEAFAFPFRKYHQLIIISVISSGSIYAAINLSRLLAEGLPGLVRLAVIGTGIAVALLIQALFLFAVPLIVLEAPKTSQLLPAVFRRAWKYVAPSIFIVTMPFILTIPTTFLSLKAGLIALQLSPEFMIHSHVASLVMESIAAFLITAGATVFIIHKSSGRKDR